MTDKEEYDKYLASSEWRALADKRRELDANKCWICGSVASQDETYPVHHKTYERLYHEEIIDLVTVCPRCHTQIHNALNARKKSAKQLREDYNKEVAERIKEIDERYVEKRAEIMADAVLETVSDCKPQNINSIVSYFQEALKLDSSTIHRNLLQRNYPNAFTRATQLVSQRRRAKKK